MAAQKKTSFGVTDNKKTLTTSWGLSFVVSGRHLRTGPFVNTSAGGLIVLLLVGKETRQGRITERGREREREMISVQQHLWLF